MGFYEDIAEALDSEGIESRIADDTLFVPITPDLEIQFVQIFGEGPAQSVQAANVFLAMADVTEDDEEFEAALVGVVFSVDAAVEEVAKHVATDLSISVINELIEGQDDRLEELDFEQDPMDPLLVLSPVGENSLILVQLDQDRGDIAAKATFVTHGANFDELLEQANEELLDADVDISEEERQAMFDSLISNVGEMTREALELGTFEDFDELFDALAIAAQQAYDWEDMLVPLEDGFEDFEEFEDGDEED